MICGSAVFDRRGHYLQPIGFMACLCLTIGVRALRCGSAFSDRRGQDMQPFAFLHVAVIDRRGQYTQSISLRALGDSSSGSFALRFVSSLA